MEPITIKLKIEEFDLLKDIISGLSSQMVEISCQISEEVELLPNDDDFIQLSKTNISENVKHLINRYRNLQRIYSQLYDISYDVIRK